MTMRKRILIAGVFVLVLAGSGAGAYAYFKFARAERLADYYPMEPFGRRWEYVVTERGPSAGASRTGKAVFTALGEGTLDGQKTVVVGVERETPGTPESPGSHVYVRNHFAASPDAIQQIAVEWMDVMNLSQQGRVTYSPPVTVGRMPLAVGETWEATTQIQSPRQGEAEFRADSKRTVRVVAREAVVVPAGRFEAVRLEVRTVSTRVGSTTPTESTRTEWRARGPGLVRLTEGPFELALKSYVAKP
jgi:hypothetical protein